MRMSGTNLSWRRRPGTRAVGGPPGWVLRSAGLPATLDIDFVNNLAWNDGASSIASLLACSRASAGYYTKADGTLQSFGSNVLRYGTNGLLVEEARTNIWTRSQEFDNGAWGKNRCSATADTTAAPDGTTTAETITITTGIAPLVERSPPANGTYAASVYAKFGTAPFICLFYYDGTSEHSVGWDIQNGTAGVVATGTAWSAPTIEALANGWYRVTATVVINGAGGTIAISPGDDANGGNGTTNGLTAHIWGAQLEAGAFATSYIPTTSASVTRNADIVTSSDLTWLDGANDSIYAEWIARNINNAKVWAFDATNDKLLDEQTGMSARIAGATVGNTAAAGATVKAAARIALNDFAISMNGGTVATDTSETAPGTLAASRLGCDLAGANHLNGYIRRVAAFKGSALGDAALQTLAA